MTAESTTLIIWTVTLSYLAIGIVLLLCAKGIQKALEQHEQRLNPTLEQLARMKITLDYLESVERVHRQDFDYSQENWQ